MVGRIDTARIVEEVGVDLAALFGELDTAALGDAQIGTFADDFGANFAAVNTQRVVRFVTRIGVSFGLCFDVSSDTAKPQKIGPGQQHGAHQFDRCHFFLVNVEAFADFGREDQHLVLAGIDAPAFGKFFLVVFVPSFDQIEQPFAFLEAGGNVWVRVAKDVKMVERADQPDFLGQ